MGGGVAPLHTCCPAAARRSSLPSCTAAEEAGWAASGLPLSLISSRAELTRHVPPGAMGGTYAAKLADWERLCFRGPRGDVRNVA